MSFICKKTFSTFGVSKMVYIFWSTYQYLLQNGTTLFFNNIRSYFRYNWPNACVSIAVYPPLVNNWGGFSSAHFPFFECPKGGFFVKNLPNNCCKIGPNHFYKILGHIWFSIEHMVGCQKFWSTSGEKDKLLPIQLEAGQIWTAAAS